MMRRRVYLSLLFALGLSLWLVGGALVVRASPSPQLEQYQTPTPGPDGRIIYIVRQGDNCLRVALLHNITVDQLRSYNPFLDENCTLIIGQELMVGLGGPASYTPTPGPSPTPAPPTATPTPFAGTTEVCALLYEDVNGDALRQAEELGIAGGAVSLTSSDGSFSDAQTTRAEIDPDTEEPVPVCFTDVPEGEYTISVGIPDGYNPTTSLSYTFEVKAGDRAFVGFGAQSQAITVETPPQQSGRVPFLGILGAVLLLGGVGLGWYAWQMQRPKGTKLRIDKSIKRR